jgi:hypothetical protein
VTAAAKIAAVARILDSARPFEQKLYRIATVLGVATAESPQRSAGGASWLRHDDPLDRDLNFDTHSHLPHRTEPEQ